MAPGADISKSIFSDLLLASNELLLLQQSGVAFNSLFNGPSWYISAMIIAMAILFPLVLSKKTKDWYVNIGGLLIAIAGYAFISQAKSDVNTANVQSINVVRFWIGFTEATLMRAVAGVSLGAFLYGLVDRVRESKIKMRLPGKISVGLAQIFLYICLFFIWQYEDVMKGGRRFDYVAIILMFFLCFIVLSQFTDVGSILPVKLCKFLGKISLPLYLNHRAVLFLYDILGWQFSYRIFLVILTGMTFASVAISELLVWLWRKLWCESLGPKVKDFLRTNEKIVDIK